VLSHRAREILIDVCTQRDYLATDGACRCLNADATRSSVKRLMALARWARLPAISCVEARRPCEARGLARPDCVIGAPGQRKLPATLLPNRVHVDCDNFLCVPLDLLQHYQQAILVKHHRDPFTNPKLDRLLTEVDTPRFVVFGAGLETSIRLLVLGLLLRGRRVALVRDACGFWNGDEGEMTLRQLEAKNCELLTTPQFIDATLTTQNRGVARLRRSVA
jgi:nicotinamidase-related amidase